MRHHFKCMDTRIDGWTDFLSRLICKTLSVLYFKRVRIKPNTYLTQGIYIYTDTIKQLKTAIKRPSWNHPGSGIPTVCEIRPVARTLMRVSCLSTTPCPPSYPPLPQPHLHPNHHHWKQQPLLPQVTGWSSFSTFSLFSPSTVCGRRCTMMYTNSTSTITAPQQLQD